jgi:hypothetical protein
MCCVAIVLAFVIWSRRGTHAGRQS